MTRKRNLMAIVAIPLALAGCENKVNTVRFGEYTLSRETFDLLAKTPTESHSFEEYVEIGNTFDKNKDKSLSIEEIKRYLEDFSAYRSMFSNMQ